MSYFSKPRWNINTQIQQESNRDIKIRPFWVHFSCHQDPLKWYIINFQQTMIPCTYKEPNSIKTQILKKANGTWSNHKVHNTNIIKKTKILNIYHSYLNWFLGTTDMMIKIWFLLQLNIEINIHLVHSSSNTNTISMCIWMCKHMTWVLFKNHQ